MANVPWLARLVRAYMRTGLRGHTRTAFWMARHFRSLQAAPIVFRDREPVFVDLRLEGSHEWLAGSPWSTSPIETGEQRLLSRVTRSGDVVFDIGANIGLHTGLLSRLVGPTGRVYAFEPNPRLASCLERTVAGLSNARLYGVALSHTEADAVLYIPVGDHTMASLADWTRGRSQSGSQQVHCPQTTLDALVARDRLPAPDVVKCDVEGAELSVFTGAYRSLNRVDAPLILFEANVHNARGFNLPVVAAKNYLQSLPLPNFDFFEVLDGGALRPAERAEFEHANILAVPESRRARIIHHDREPGTAADLDSGTTPSVGEPVATVR
jgi:FkbM family methyltransferase